ncbi:DoxX family protein [Halobacterium litoreum]|uniref:DoxX family protein n=1 Tax=Halobacterium litoreum TaxID=2039234 RepID=A0ABD5NFJ2_9EURY|nr:DoxX family protein [Halobacterium litoreum]UHH13094.1 DoxX family protein [Halobacterium litoreum]
MSTKRQLGAKILGRNVSFTYSEQWVGYSVLGLRLVMAWTFLQAGLDKLLAGDWTAAPFLLNAIPPGNPLADLFTTLGTDYVGLVNVLNVWGQILVGLALLVGAFVRFSAFWGAVMMLFYWLASLEGGLFDGLPIAHGWVVDSHLVYAVLLFGLGAIGAGRIVGVDEYLEATSVVQNNPWLRYLLG